MTFFLKRLVILAVSGFILAACGKNETATPATPATPAAPEASVAKAVASVAVPAQKSSGVVELGAVGEGGMPALAKKSNCSACHALDKKILGPSWMAVSQKYKGVATYKFNDKDYPLEEGLLLKVSKGGAGNWGTMPMPANSPAVKDEEIKVLVKFVLSLAK